MGSVVAWLLWSDLLDGWDWVLYLVVNGVMNYLLYPDKAAGQASELIHFIVWGHESGHSVH